MKPLSDRHWRIHRIVLGLVIVAAVVHHCILFLWYIDDAAISFAYAKHIAMGEGVVPTIGAERVEGYSNPAWTFFLVPFAFVGIDLIQFVRWLQPFLVVPTLIVTYLAGREGFAGLDDDDESIVRHLPLVAPAVLAVSAQFSLWTGAGLEIALMDLLMALAIWRSLVELRTGEWPLSALLWLGVALCRPEAILYAAMAGAWAMVHQLLRGRGLAPTARWLVTFFVPFGLYQAWRYVYFAWELPNTYYAKIGEKEDPVYMRWAGQSWTYTRNFAHEMGWGYYLPVWMLGAMGHRAWRGWVAVVMAVMAALVIGIGVTEPRVAWLAVGFLALAVAWNVLDRRDADHRLYWAVLGGVVLLLGAAELAQYAGVAMEPELPTALRGIPPYVLVSFALTALGIAYTDERTPLRSLVLALCLAAVLFAIVAQWDWMKGYRWYAPVVVPGALLLALGLHHAAVELVPRVLPASVPHVRAVVGVWGLAVALAIPPNVLQTVDRVRNPDASPRGVSRRVDYMKQVEQRLHLEERVRDLEVDMGAHMLWTDFELVDLAGLIDVPMGHHRFPPAFVDEYIFEEQRPHFVHLHKQWERNSRIKTRPMWRNRAYIEIPGYAYSDGTLHGGNHVRRDLVLPLRWPHGDVEPVALEAGVRVYGVDVPSEPPAGGSVYLEVGVAQLDRAGQDDFRMWLAARRGAVVHRWDLDPGYGWVPPRQWIDDEIFVGRYSLPLPDAIEPGAWALSLVVIGQEGEPRSIEGTDEHEVPLGTLQVLTPEAAVAAAEADRRAALEAASLLQCDDAERSWFLARKHRVDDPEWREQHRDAVRRALAECWAGVATGLPRDEKVQALIRAREHDHWSPTYRIAARELAGTLYAEGHEARDRADWEAAYRAFSDAVAVDRSWSWARRYAEEARAHRLGLRDADVPEQTAQN